MPYVVSLIGFVPPPRYDAVPWTSARIQEAPAPDGPWTTIDTQVLPSPDPDPTAPGIRNLTTSHGTLEVGWYRIIFLDVSGGQSEPSDPVRNTVDDSSLPPSPDAIRNGSPLLRKGYPVPFTDPYSPIDLRTIVYQATAMVQSFTWRTIDPTLGCAAPDDYQCEIVPDALVPTAIQAITRMAERLYVTTEPGFAKQIATGRRLRGFNAGPYSESYFAPGEFMRRGVVVRPPMDSDDALDSALWALATEDARDYFVWRSTGMAPPTGVATAFDYRRESLGYGAGGGGGYGGGFAHGGPDGL